MNNFVTIKTFTYPYEIAIIRGRLESEGIECRVQDELTVQVDPFYSNAIGGLKLQVKESDVKTALEILKEAGYPVDKELPLTKLQGKLDKATSEILFIKNIRPEFRLLIIVATIASIVLGILYFITLPTPFEQLTKNRWCVDKVFYAGKEYQPRTVETRLIFNGVCKETIYFGVNGNISMPGLNSASAQGIWHLENNTLHIQQTDTFSFVYNGTYKINFKGNELILKSPNTTIWCYFENSTFNF